MDLFSQGRPSDHANGVIEANNQILSNVVAIAAQLNLGLALKSDGTVVGFGFDYLGNRNVPAGLSNVASIAIDGGSSWAIKHDGTVAKWGGEQRGQQIVAGLSNVSAITRDGVGNYFALRNDGTVAGFPVGPSVDDGISRERDSESVQTVRVRGEVVRDVAAVAFIGYRPLILKRDGTLYELASWPEGLPFQYASANPVLVNSAPLSNVSAIVGGVGQALALNRDGTVVAWDRDGSGEATVPRGLTNVVAIASDEQLSLALRRDGTVVAWGSDSFGQTSVPTGLSNVIAIASGGTFGLALTTGDIPPGVFIQPHGRLEEMARESDVIFKGQAVSSVPFTNAAFQNPQMDVHATRFKVISVLKGEIPTNTLVFQHYTKDPGAWSGAHWPPFYQFEPGQSYIVFAANLDRPDKYYSPPPGTRRKADEFRQFAGYPRSDDDGVTRTLNDRPLDKIPFKQAHWLELNRLLNDTNPTNQLYAIRHLDLLSTNCATSWGHTEDFKREQVLNAFAPLLTNANDEVAVTALNCFRFGPGCVQQIAPYADTLIQIAARAPSQRRRVAAIRGFSGTGLPALTNWLADWLKDTNANVRAESVMLLPDFPGNFSEQALRECASDRSAKVRAAVADAIGNGRIASLLPTLANLFTDPVGRTNPVAPLTIDQLEEGMRIVGVEGGVTMVDDPNVSGVNVGDVHTSAGFALLRFELDQVSDILKTNLTDRGFRLSFLCRLAEKGAGPWLNDMAEVMAAWRVREERKAASWGTDPKNYLPALSGTHFECWNIMYRYLHDLPPEEFAGGKLDRILNVLEKAGTTGSQEPKQLYELYRMKGLNQRAAQYRSFCEKTFSYDIGYVFKQVDAEYTNSPAKREP